MKNLNAYLIILMLTSISSLGVSSTQSIKMKQQNIFKSDSSSSGFNGFFSQFRNLFTSDAKVANKKGVELRNLGKYAEASYYFKKATEHDPNYARAHYNLGHMLFILGKDKEALASLNRAVSLHGNGAGFTTRGVVRLALGDIKGALEDQNHADASRVANNQPEWGVIHFNRGCAKMFAGDASGAVVSFARAKQLLNPELKLNMAQVTSDLKQKVESQIRLKKGKFSSADLNNRQQQATPCGIVL